MKTVIHVNQIGYYASRRKTAAVIGRAAKFSLIENASGKTVFTGTLSGAVADSASGDKVRTADFTEFSVPGEYRIAVGRSLSHSFSISEAPYADVRNALQKFFCLSRCGTDLTEKFAGTYRRRKCHTASARLFSKQEKKIDVSGGWHDAGDYGRYVVTAAAALGSMLYAYEMFPDTFAESINIPESGNGFPDILNECRWELGWLLKMQRGNGSVYHKAVTLSAADTVMPSADDDNVFVMEPSASATLLFCAVTALAARIFSETDGHFSRALQAASLNAWEWVEKQKELKPFKNPHGVSCLEYAEWFDEDFRDDIFWAASELYSLTGEKKYLNRMMDIYEQIDTTSFSKSAVGGFGALSYLTNEKTKNPVLTEALKNAFVFRCENFLALAKHSGYNTAMENESYIWGSNREIAGRIMTLAAAYHFTGNEIYISVCVELINYLFGKNPMGTCYVTGFGACPAMFPHHRPSAADHIDAPVPGMLVGGPDRLRSDEYSRWHIPKGTPPAKCYLDKEYCYSANNVSVSWNASAVFALAFLDSLNNDNKKG